MSSPDSASDSDPGRSSLGRQVAVAAVFVVLGSSVLWRTTAIRPGVAVGGLAVLACVAVAALAARTTETVTGEDGDSDGTGDSDVWNAIPSWQYEGRHVESGGLARGEQERALRDVQRQADELSEEPTRE